jgi:histone H3/H4
MCNNENEQPTAEILIVASKLKTYIRTKAGMNTSGSVPEALSNKVRQLCDAAIEKAKADGRKTVMDRDFSDEAN